MPRRAAALALLAVLTACGPSTKAPEPPRGVEITYLEPIPDHTPPTLRGKIVNTTGTTARQVEYRLFYGEGGERELEPLVLQDIPARGYREFDVPLPHLERLPTSWRAEFARIEWAGSAPFQEASPR